MNAFRLWLEWLDSHEGRLWRRRQGGDETDRDCIGLVPTPPGSVILTVGDLRAAVRALDLLPGKD